MSRVENVPTPTGHASRNAAARLNPVSYWHQEVHNIALMTRASSCLHNHRPIPHLDAAVLPVPNQIVLPPTISLPLKMAASPVIFRLMYYYIGLWTQVFSE